MILERNPRISREMHSGGATVGVRLAPIGSAPGIAWAVQLVPAGNQNWLDLCSTPRRFSFTGLSENAHDALVELAADLADVP